MLDFLFARIIELYMSEKTGRLMPYLLNHHRHQQQYQIHQHNTRTHRSIELIRNHHPDGETDQRNHSGTDCDTEEVAEYLSGNEAREENQAGNEHGSHHSHAKYDSNRT